jgi:hypothetical protein
VGPFARASAEDARKTIDLVDDDSVDDASSFDRFDQTLEGGPLQCAA